MDNFAYFYIEANIVCIIIAIILIFRAIKSPDRQVRQREFIKTVFSYIVFFSFDILWVFLTINGKSTSLFLYNIVYFCIFTVFAVCSYQWFVYSEIVQGNMKIYNNIKRFLWFIPIIITFLIGFFYPIVVYKIKRSYLLNSYSYAIHYLMIILSIIYGGIASFNAFRRAFKRKNYLNKGLYLVMAFYPIVLMLAIILQVRFIKIPIICFLSTIIMLCYYFIGVDKLISVDPLTKLNNRAQLKKYYHNLSRSGDKKYYLLIIDIDNFKSINDIYGHIEGDIALKLVARTFLEVAAEFKYKTFVSRYGGDEFVIILTAPHKKYAEELELNIKRKLLVNSAKKDAPYQLSVSIGISKLKEKYNTLEKGIEHADIELYKEKHEKKLEELD